MTDILRRIPPASDLQKARYEKIGTIEELETRVDVLEAANYATHIDALDVRVTDLESLPNTSPKWYIKGRLSHNGTSAPTFTGVANFDYTATRVNTGRYRLNPTSEYVTDSPNVVTGIGREITYSFTFSKYYFIEITVVSNGGFPTPDAIQILVSDISGGATAYADNVIFNHPINIEIY